jgi:hypothetical protein
MEILSYILSVVALLLSVVLAIFTGFSIKKNRALKEQLTFARNQFQRAATLLFSEDVTDILAGIEILRVFKFSDERIRLLPRIIELARHENKHIAASAAQLKNEIVFSVEESDPPNLRVQVQSSGVRKVA